MLYTEKEKTEIERVRKVFEKHITGIRPRHTAEWQNYSRNQPGPMPGLPTGRHYRTTRS